MIKEQANNGARGGKSTSSVGQTDAIEKGTSGIYAEPTAGCHAEAIGEKSGVATALGAGCDLGVAKERCRGDVGPQRQDAGVSHRRRNMNGQQIDDLPKRLREVASMDRATCAEALTALRGVTLPPRLRAGALRRLLAYELQARACWAGCPQRKGDP